MVHLGHFVFCKTKYSSGEADDTTASQGNLMALVAVNCSVTYM